MLIEKVHRYTGALSRWIKAGRPVRPAGEIRNIYAQKCVPCENYGRKTSTCRLCGCRVDTKRTAFLNKIAMGTEHCPAGKW